MTVIISELLTSLEDNSIYSVGKNISNNNDKYNQSICCGNGANNLSRATQFVRKVVEQIENSLANGDKYIVKWGQEFDLSKDQIFLKVHGDCFSTFVKLETGNLVGELKGKIDGYDFSVKVSSRFGVSFLFHMITSSEGFMEIKDLGSYSERAFIKWLLVFLWKRRLLQSYILGVPKLYVGIKDKIPLIRGNFDIKEHLRAPVSTGTYPCQYREHNYNNPVTRLIYTVFQILYRNDELHEIVSDLHKVKNTFAEACNGNRITQRDHNHFFITNPYFLGYEEVVSLSKKILLNENIDLGIDHKDFSGFLFDISLLFESHIRKVLIRESHDLTIKKLTPDSPETVRYPTGGNNGKTRRSLLPDIIIEGKSKTLILDVKYKRWHNDKGVSREDSFQLISYAAAYKKQFEKLTGFGFVFPSDDPKARSIFQEFPELGIGFYIFFLVIPEKGKLICNETFNDFQTQMKKNESIFVNEINRVLKGSDLI